MNKKIDWPTLKSELKATADVARKVQIELALVDAGGNITRAADALQISRAQLSRLLVTYALVDAAAHLRLVAGGRVSRNSSSGKVTGRPRTRARPKV